MPSELRKLTPSVRRFPIRQPLAWVLILTVTSGCAGPHYDWTREIGLSPPMIEEEGDYYADAKARCEQFDQGTPVLPACIQHHETLLWAGDYKSFMSARATLNRNIIYVGGVVALASVSVLLGLTTFGQTSSDAYKILPIAGTFLGGLLGFSKNDSLYEAYQLAATKMDQAIRRAQARATTHTLPAYQEAAEALRRDVGSAVDELEQAKLSIVKFQTKSEADQFRNLQQAVDQEMVGGVSLKEVSTDKPGAHDPDRLLVTLTEPPDPKKFPMEELRIKLVEIASKAEPPVILRVSRIDGAQLTADIPESLRHHDDRRYGVQVQARHGAVTLRDSRSVDLTWTKRRLIATVTGDGVVTVTVTDPGAAVAPAPLQCKKDAPCELIWTKQDTKTTITLAAEPAIVATSPVWGEGASTPPECAAGQLSCKITLDRDKSVSVQFK